MSRLSLVCRLIEPSECCQQFSFNSCLIAVKNNHLNCLKRAYWAGCPLSKNVVETAKNLKHTECLRFAQGRVNTTL